MQSKTQFLVVGAGMSGLAFANAIRDEAQQVQRPLADDDVLVVEADSQAGGYCKTIEQDGFVWDYSGHFFHFKHAHIEAWLRARMTGEDIRTVKKQSLIRFRSGTNDVDIDFPFQKNIHQLPQDDFIACLVDLYFRAESTPKDGIRNFKDMLYARFGKGIAEKFLIPYNEKLYACDLSTLDVDAMGRFFPHANMDDIIRNMRNADNSSYNDVFTYPKSGAYSYVKAMLHDLPASSISYNERVLQIDLKKRVATTNLREIHFVHLVSSMPLAALARLTALPVKQEAFTWNQVLCFNLGFDKKGRDDVHWMYFPDRDICFYRIGFYDNIHSAPRMSLYVEIGFPSSQEITAHDVETYRLRVLADLQKLGFITDQKLVSWHHVVMNPAYVHITQDSLRETERAKAQLATGGVYSIGRYGSWTYCSIEDNIVEARALAARFRAVL